MPGHGREVTKEQHWRTRRRPPQQPDDRVLRVVKVNPLETRVVKVHFIESGMRLIQPVELPDVVLQLAMILELEQVPLNAGVMVPFTPLPNFTAHEQQFFSRVRIHVAEKCAHIRKLLPHIPGHFTEQRPLAVHHLVM